MDLQLAERTAFVLAASKGLGRASAKAFVREGASVVISSRSMDNLQEAKSTIVDDTGADPDRVIPIVCDLGDPNAVPDRIEDGIDRLGGLDVLVTNSWGPPKVGFDEATIDQFDRTYTTVLRSVILAIDTALPSLIERQGAVTNIVAASAQQPEANHILANTIRPSLYGLSKSLAHEYASDGVRVNCVCPKKVGPVTPEEKDRTTHIDDYAAEHDLSYEAARAEYIADIIPLGTHGELRTFGDAVAYVSSDVASHVTGECFNVDGGWTRSLC